MSVAVSLQSSPAVIATWSDIGPDDIGGALTIFLGDGFALYLKTANFRWRMSRQPTGCYLMLDEQADEVSAMRDVIAGQGQKRGGRTIELIAEVIRRQRLQDRDAVEVPLIGMLTELYGDNLVPLGFQHEEDGVCELHERN
jgi:starvation-inducible DNA-binding protein